MSGGADGVPGFTLGVGNYTEKDVQEAARAFTGWSFVRTAKGKAEKAPAQFMFKPILHDDGPKTFLGKSGNFTGEEVIGILCANPQLATYVTTKSLELVCLSKS